MFAKERPVSTPKQGKRRATFKNRGICVEHMLELFFFFVSLKVGRFSMIFSIISMNFHISTIQIGHGVGDLCRDLLW
jgi:hypothetical protein